MKYRIARVAPSAGQVATGRAFVKFLAESFPPDKAYTRLLKDMVGQLDGYSDEYLLHDHLEAVNQPFYFHEFIEHAGRNRLAYLGDTCLRLMLPEAFPPTVAASLRQLTNNPIEIEQYMDFMRNQPFRTTLLCRQESPIHRTLVPDRLDGLFLSAAVTCQEPSAETPAGSTPFQVGNLKLNVDDPALSAVLQELAAATPTAIPFLELIEKSKLTPAAADQVGKQLLNLFLVGELDLLSAAPPCSALTTRPRGRKLAQLQVQTGTVVNLLHKGMTIPELAGIVLPMLDGTHDRQYVIDELIRLFQAGKLKANPGATTDQVLQTMPALVDKVLQGLSFNALLVG